MAKDKKSFVLYADMIHAIEYLTNEEKGRLFQHILEYVNDMNPVMEDRLILTAWKPIENQLKRDLDKWKDKKCKFSQAGLISAKSKRLQKGRQLYILKVSNNEEFFIKVGITDSSIGRRFSSKDTFKGTDYKFEVVDQFFIENPLKLEESIKYNYETLRYSPLQKFGGHTECFCLDALKDIVQYSTTFNDVEDRSTKSTVTVNDTVNDTVNVINKEKDKKKIVANAPVSKSNKIKTYKQWTNDDFKEVLNLFIGEHTNQTLKDFYSYWSEPTASGKMRLTTNKSWDTSRRLKTWTRNNFNNINAPIDKNKYNARR